MRKAGTSGAITRQAIREAAIELIATHGFESMSLRALAAKCGIKAGSLYNYFGSKQDLLRDLLQDVMEELLREFDEQVRPLEGVIDQIRAFVRLHILFHTRRRMEVIIGNTELRSLTEENYRLVTQLRGEYESRLRKIIARGIELSAFRVPDAKVTSFMIIAALTGVGYWYRPNGSLSQRKLIAIHEQLVLQALGVDPAVYSSVGGEGESETARESRAEPADEAAASLR